MKNIKLLNKIAPVGIEVFDKTKYYVSENAESPEGIMVRSADLLNAEFGPELKAIARAGAGVNNIPVKKCSGKRNCSFQYSRCKCKRCKRAYNLRAFSCISRYCARS